jgi:PTS system mannose-specific IID component
MGLTLSMEKENAANPDFDESSINAVKVGLMGPLAGLGDSFFWGTLRVIAAGIGIGIATSGNILGPILFLLVYNIPNLLVRYYGAAIGYSFGSKYITAAAESGLLQTVTKSASIMGLMMVGAMSASMVSFTIKYPIAIGGVKIVLQDILDKLLIGFVPLVIVLVCFILLRKKVNPNWILLGLVAFGFGCATLGIL